MTPDFALRINRCVLAGCLAIARICHVPEIDENEDQEIAWLVIDQSADIQKQVSTFKVS